MNKRISVMQTIDFYRSLEIEKLLSNHLAQILTSIDVITPFSDEGNMDALKSKNKILDDLAISILGLLNHSAKKYNSNTK